jgi:hypothetical protein
MIEIGSYLLELNREATARCYESLPVYEGQDPAVLYFHHLRSRASEESLSFLNRLGIDPQKISVARPVSEPDEKGEILYLCVARLCGTLLAGGDQIPRQSEERAGMSLIFVDDEKAFHPRLPSFPKPELELRFVIPLSFDASFFQREL